MRINLNILVLWVAFWSFQVLAKDMDKRAMPAALPAANEPAAISEASVFNTVYPSSVSMGPSLGFYDGDVGYGTGLTVTHEAKPHFSMGGEFGYYQWIIGDTAVADRYFTIIPVLVTAKYSFEATRWVHPYIGASAGVAFLTRTNSRVLFAGNSSAKEEGTEFFAELRPGVDFNVTSDGTFLLYTETKTGLLRGQLIFLPQMGAVFRF